ncbi:MAG: hypothetical protein PHD01_16490 [Geobacteraceae bacterium]|nr:hypothetical protein [Geobacteraceae bacterium]
MASVRSSPGNDVALSRGRVDVFPFIAVRKVLEGETTADAWGRVCAAVPGDAVLGFV